jgi:hypothetical protein
MISHDAFLTNVFNDYDDNAFAFFGNSLLNIGRKFGGHRDIGNGNVRVGVALVTDYAIGTECIIVIAPLPRQCTLFLSRHGMACDNGDCCCALLEIVGIGGGVIGGGDDKNKDRYRDSLSSKRPYATSSYYAVTSNVDVLSNMGEAMTMHSNATNGWGRMLYQRKEKGMAESKRLVILRPFCDFGAYNLTTMNEQWNRFVLSCAVEMVLGADINNNGRAGGCNGEGIINN